jgi:hypothetical protein
VAEGFCRVLELDAGVGEPDAHRAVIQQAVQQARAVHDPVIRDLADRLCQFEPARRRRPSKPGGR